MCAKQKLVTDVELLPGELMRQLVFDNQATSSTQVPIQQSRFVLPDDTDEDDIEHIDIDPPSSSKAQTTKQLTAISFNDGQLEKMPERTDQMCSRVVDKSQSIPVEIKENKRRAEKVVDKTHESSSQPCNDLPPSRNPNRSRRKNHNKYGLYRSAPNIVPHPNWRREADLIPSMWSYDDHWRQPSYIDYYRPSAFRTRRTYFPPIADYLMCNSSPNVIPIIPIIW